MTYVIEHQGYHDAATNAFVLVAAFRCQDCIVARG
jgi:hypothetical protein